MGQGRLKSSSCKLRFSTSFEIRGRSGRLVFNRVISKNVASVGKWCWGFPLVAFFWWNVIKSKYSLCQNGFGPQDVRMTHHCPWKLMSQISAILKPGRFKIQDGKQIRFWEDVSRGEQPLCGLFLAFTTNIFSIMLHCRVLIMAKHGTYTGDHPMTEG